MPSSSSKEALLARRLSQSWNLPSFMVKLTRSTPCSCSDPPFPRQGATLAHLDSLLSHDHVTKTDGIVPFAFGKGYGVLTNCSFCVADATLLHSADQRCSSSSTDL